LTAGSARSSACARPYFPPDLRMVGIDSNHTGMPRQGIAATAETPDPGSRRARDRESAIMDNAIGRVIPPPRPSTQPHPGLIRRHRKRLPKYVAAHADCHGHNAYTAGKHRTGPDDFPPRLAVPTFLAGRGGTELLWLAAGSWCHPASQRAPAVLHRLSP